MIHARIGWVSLVSLVCTISARAENRFVFEDGTLPARAAAEPVTLWLENDVPVLGFSFGAAYDPTQLSLTAVTVENTLAAEADFFDGKIDAAQGLVGFGCVLDWDPPIDEYILPGGRRPLARLVFAVLGEPGSTTELRLQTVRVFAAPNPPVKNVITDDTGRSIAPALVNGTFVIEDRTPRILSLAGNRGVPGDVFTVVGEYFGEPGLRVTVCDASAEFSLGEDGKTLSVVAPACGSLGFARLEVCTVRGCDSRADGFEYLAAVRAFVRGETNLDGSLDIADAVTVLLYLFAGSVSTTCPDRFDANDDGQTLVSDAVYLIQYLFRGGPAPPAPYPEEGLDPTADLLPVCQ